MLHIQSVERRLMLFAELIDRPEINGQELRVTGTAGDDVIRVEYNPAGDRLVATLNGQSLDFDPTAAKRISVLAGDGNDSVFVASGPTRFAGLSGGAGNDSLTSTGGSDTLLGEAGNDLLDGGTNNDQLRGGDGDDQLFGRGGNDFLAPAAGADLVDGGSGRNEATYEERTDDLSLSLDGVANDGAAGESGNVLRIQRLSGGTGDDLIVGDSENNDLIGGQGADTILGQGGDDTLIDYAPADFDGGANDSLDGGSGNDQLDCSAGADTLNGGAGSDTLNGGIGSDLMRGGSGNDVIELLSDGGTGDTAFGDSGDDNVTIGDGSHTADGGSGGDFFSAIGEGQSTVLGQSGNDTVATDFPDVSSGDPDDDLDASGGSGTDTLLVTGPQGVRVTLDNLANDGRAEDSARAANIRSDFERFNGNVGNDFVDASAAPRGVFISGAFGEDTLIGGAFADLLEGDDGVDSLVGNAGEDVLRGGPGRDTLNGGPGSDSFNGGKGDDTMLAADGEADVVNGAQALGDSADIDELLDTVIRVESTT